MNLHGYFGKQLPDDLIGDRELSKKLKPRIRLGGNDYEHFVARGAVPDHFTEMLYNSPSGGARVMRSALPETWASPTKLRPWTDAQSSK